MSNNRYRDPEQSPPPESHAQIRTRKSRALTAMIKARLTMSAATKTITSTGARGIDEAIKLGLRELIAAISNEEGL